jgi:hypothetical protein
MDYVREDPASIPADAKSFLISTASRAALGATQPSLQWVPRSLLPGVQRPMHEAEHFHLMPTSRTVEIYLNSPIRLHESVIN